MEINPYQPPADFSASLADDPAPTSGPRTRPIGVWILSGLHVLVGLFLAMAVAGILWQFKRLDDPLRVIRIIVMILAVTAALGLSSGAGLWLGKRWGWWLASFYYVWAVLGVVADFMLMPFHAHRLDTESIVVTVLGKVIQLVIHAILLGYLLKSNVRAFCGLQSLRIDRALVPMVGIAVVLLAVTIYWTITRFPDPF